jgi:hypothetical protein
MVLTSAVRAARVPEGLNPRHLTRCTSSKPLVPQALSCLDLAMFAQWSRLMVLWLTLSSIGVPIAR